MLPNLIHCSYRAAQGLVSTLKLVEDIPQLAVSKLDRVSVIGRPLNAGGIVLAVLAPKRMRTRWLLAMVSILLVLRVTMVRVVVVVMVMMVLLLQRLLHGAAGTGSAAAVVRAIFRQISVLHCQWKSVRRKTTVRRLCGALRTLCSSLPAQQQN